MRWRSPELRAVQPEQGLSKHIGLGFSIPPLRYTLAMAAPPHLQGLLLAVNTLLRKRRYHAAFAVLKGFRNGAV